MTTSPTMVSQDDFIAEMSDGYFIVRAYQKVFTDEDGDSVHEIVYLGKYRDYERAKRVRNMAKNTPGFS